MRAMKSPRALPGSILFLCVLVCIAASAQPTYRYEQKVSMIALIANPGRYDGRHIRTEGYFSFLPHNSAIFVTRGHARDRSLLNGISVTLDGSSFEKTDLSRLSGQRVLIDGEFQKPAPGYDLRGFIVGVSAIIPLESLSDD